MKNINPEPIKKSVSPYSQETRLMIEKKKRKINFEKSNTPPFTNRPENMSNKNKGRNNVQETKTVGPLSTNTSKRKKLIFIVSLLIIILLAGAIFVVYNLLFLKQNVIVSNPGGVAPILRVDDSNKLSASMVNKDGDTRVNIVITGMGGKNHKGGSLTDSIQILSIDPFNNEAGIVSLPRDLYVLANDKNPRKINTVYQIGEKQGKGQGGALVKKVVGDILDLKIHYFVNIDFVGFEKIIDSLGGVSVNIEKALKDPFYPDPQLEGYDPFYISAGVHLLDGETALKYARSRQTTSDFDRSNRQQLIMMAVKEKAVSLGILANPSKINEIVKIVGTHLTTDIQLESIKSFTDIYRKIQSDSTKSVVIDNSTKGPLVSTPQYGSYGLVPAIGFNKYNDVQNFAHTAIIDPKIKEEKPTINITYPKLKAKEAKTIIDKLTTYGYTITDGGQITKNVPTQNQIIFRAKNKPFTEKYLTTRYTDFVQTSEKSSSDLSDVSIVLGSK